MKGRLRQAGSGIGRRQGGELAQHRGDARLGRIEFLDRREEVARKSRLRPFRAGRAESIESSRFFQRLVGLAEQRHELTPQ